MSVTVGKTTVYKLRDVRSGLSECGVRLSCALRSVGRVDFLCGAEMQMFCSAMVAMSNI